MFASILGGRGRGRKKLLATSFTPFSASPESLWHKFQDQGFANT